MITKYDCFLKMLAATPISMQQEKMYAYKRVQCTFKILVLIRSVTLTPIKL